MRGIVRAAGTESTRRMRRAARRRSVQHTVGLVGFVNFNNASYSESEKYFTSFLLWAVVSVFYFMVRARVPIRSTAGGRASEGASARRLLGSNEH